MTHTSGHGHRGVAPLIIILAIVVIGGGIYAVVNRDVLKTYFETGDVPTQDEFSNSIDSKEKGKESDASAGKGSDTAVSVKATLGAKVLTESQKEFKLDADQAVTFRWTPIVPKPQEPVMYRLKVWQLMQGQSGTTAMRENKPIVTKDVDNVTEASVSGIYTGPCRPPYLCDYVWSVEATSAASAGTGAAADSAAGTR